MDKLGVEDKRSPVSELTIGLRFLQGNISLVYVSHNDNILGARFN